MSPPFCFCGWGGGGEHLPAMGEVDTNSQVVTHIHKIFPQVWYVQLKINGTTNELNKTRIDFEVKSSGWICYHYFVTMGWMQILWLLACSCICLIYDPKFCKIPLGIQGFASLGYKSRRLGLYPLGSVPLYTYIYHKNQPKCRVFIPYMDPMSIFVFYQTKTSLVACNIPFQKKGEG